MAEQKLKTRLQNKRGTSAEWAAATNFIPLAGEICFYSDLNAVKIGDGSTKITELPFINDCYQIIGDNVSADVIALLSKDYNAKVVYGQRIFSRTRYANVVDGEGLYYTAHTATTLQQLKIAENGTVTITSHAMVNTDSDQNIGGVKTFTDEIIVGNKESDSVSIAGNWVTLIDGPLENGKATQYQVDGIALVNHNGDAKGYKLTFPLESGKIALTSDLPTNYVTTDTAQPDITGHKVFKNGLSAYKDLDIDMGACLNIYGVGTNYVECIFDTAADMCGGWIGANGYGALKLGDEKPCELQLGGNAGTSGQVLTSQGSGKSPIWTTPSGSGGSGATNIVNGTGSSALQQVQDGTTGTFDFTGKNANATAADSTLTGNIAYGGTGAFATVFGGKAAAMGKRSLAAGTTTIAKGDYSAAFGNSAVTMGPNSFATGLSTTAKGTGAFAIGMQTLASGDYSLAAGYKTTANAYGSIAEGGATVVLNAKPASGTTGGGSTPSIGTTDSPDNHLGTYAHAEGDTTVAMGYAAKASGVLSKAYAHYSQATGYNCVVGDAQSPSTGVGSYVGGYNTTTKNNFTFAHGLGLTDILNTQEAIAIVGAYNKDVAGARFIVGNGDSTSSRSNAMVVWRDGHVSIAKGPTASDDVANLRYVNGQCDNTLNLAKSYTDSKVSSYAMPKGILTIKINGVVAGTYNGGTGEIDLTIPTSTASVTHNDIY